MSPHDMLGRELEPGQLTIVSNGDSGRHLCYGIVERVIPATGCVDVKILQIGRIPEEQVHRFSFPANQLFTFGFEQLNKHNPIHKKLLALLQKFIDS